MEEVCPSFPCDRNRNPSLCRHPSSGASVATTLGKGFLAIRKAGHLCVATHNQNYTDYTGREKTMETS
ncbi:hypothetical protein INR49_016489 [Caranx melampygus]|nr:hypothetical protein INR49_016489 [Caranx melampygus]